MISFNRRAFLAGILLGGFCVRRAHARADSRLPAAVPHAALDNLASCMGLA